MAQNQKVLGRINKVFLDWKSTPFGWHAEYEESNMFPSLAFKACIQHERLQKLDSMGVLCRYP
jgi:hypothetical protein